MRKLGLLFIFALIVAQAAFASESFTTSGDSAYDLIIEDDFVTYDEFETSSFRYPCTYDYGHRGRSYYNHYGSSCSRYGDDRSVSRSRHLTASSFTLKERSRGAFSSNYQYTPRYGSYGGYGYGGYGYAPRYSGYHGPSRTSYGGYGRSGYMPYGYVY